MIFGSIRPDFLTYFGVVSSNEKGPKPPLGHGRWWSRGDARLGVRLMEQLDQILASPDHIHPSLVRNFFASWFFKLLLY